MASSSNHGSVRGSYLPRESRLFEGRFGRMFRSVPPFDLDPAEREVRDLAKLVAADGLSDSTGEKVAVMAGKEPGGPSAETAVDEEENPHVPAGYTYLGQFIDHDLTFDPASSLQRQNDPEALVNFRTPRFDLDSVYGRGPADQPYMYDMPAKGPARLFLLGDKIGIPPNGPHLDQGALDHLRGPANQAKKRRAIIGDKRNDENTIIAQMHTVFLRFHNRLATAHADWSFEEVQEAARWHYQWVVLHDYLNVIVGKTMVQSILPHLAQADRDIFKHAPKLRHYNYDYDPYLPTEFSTAAFRFGHSMVRPVYRLSRTFQNLAASGLPEIEDHNVDKHSRRMIFDPDPAKGLNGFGAIFQKWAIEWDLFFKMSTSGADHTSGRVQPSYKIDTSLVDPLGSLPEFADAAAKVEMNLAYRNILRGFAMKLPCGEDVARVMGEVPLDRKWLRIGKAESPGDWNDAPFIDDAAMANGSRPFVGHTPLWLYILCEGAKNALESTPAHPKPALGPVGGRIVAETLVGILLGDKHSFIRRDPRWTPLAACGGTKLDMARFIQFATGKPVDP
jgi:Animal haem peroxidase